MAHTPAVMPRQCQALEPEINTVSASEVLAVVWVGSDSGHTAPPFGCSYD